MTRVLVLSPHPHVPGGVVDYVRMLHAHLPPEVRLEFLHTGARRLPRLLRPAAPLVPLYDALRLAWRLMTRAPDAVHINPSFNKAVVRDSLFMLVLRGFGLRRVLVLMHGWNDGWARRVLGGRVTRLLVRRLWGDAGQILVLASRFRQALTEAGLDAGRVAVVSTMFDPEQFAGLESRRGEQGAQVLFLSRFVREKGCYEVLEGFARVAAEFPDASLTCAGDGPEAAGMRAWVVANGLTARVRFPGYVRGPDKARLLLDADVFAFPTYYGEGCPVSLLEAMAGGCAVITADAGGIADIVRDGEHGALLATPTAVGVAEALRALLADRARCHAIGAHNRAVAMARYQADGVATDMAARYARLAARRGS